MTKRSIFIADQIPDFTAFDQEGNPFKAKDLEGCPTILFFYSDNYTPEGVGLCNLYNDYLGEFYDFEAVVIAVNAESPESNIKFMNKHMLQYPLISDKDLVVSHLFGVVKEEAKTKKEHIVTTTFLIDTDKTICWIEKEVDSNGHIDRLIEALERYCG